MSAVMKAVLSSCTLMIDSLYRLNNSSDNKHICPNPHYIIGHSLN